MFANLTRRHLVKLYLCLLIIGIVPGMAFGSAAVTLTDANTRTNPVTYGPVGPNFLTNIPLPTQTTACDQTHPCDETPLTVNLSPANLVNMRVTVQVQWPNHEADSDFDLYVFRGGTEIARDAGVFDPEIASFNAVNGSNYNIRVVIFDPQGESFTVKVFYEPIPSPNPAPTGPSARFQVYPAPSSVSSVAAAALEPSIGVNWNTGVVATQCDIHTLFTTFDDCSSPASDTWVQRDADNTAIDFDPILFTDIFTGRTFNSLLVTDPVAFTTGCSEANQTDDDGFTWVAQDGCSKPGGSDHQSLGGGPYHAPLIGTPAYPNAVYYCAQDPGATLTAPAFCARSDDGGLTFGPAVAAYTVECFGLHGHIKVGPDGTVFLPVRYCSAGGFAGDGFAYSEDNGTTWKVSVVPGSSRSASDPSVGIGLNNVGKPVGQASNTVYLGYCDGNGHPMVAVSHDLGTTYVNVFDVGVSKGLQNCAFPDMVAGDDNRGMLYFLGSTTGGDFQPSSFAGEWHAYVASTYDGGATWGLTDVTPTQPVQIGCIWLQGGSNACRNLLDFNDATLDKDGRLTAVFAAGCRAPGCVAGSPAGNSRARYDNIIRQSGGKRLFAANDPVEPAVPGAPRLGTATRGANGVTVKWSEPDNGGSTLTGYNIYRGSVPLTEGFLATIDASKPEFIDTTAAAGTPYFYQVTAINARGESGKCQEVAVTGQQVVQTICKLPGITVNTDPAADQTGTPANAGLDIRGLDVAEPFTTPGDKSITFTMTVAALGTTPQPQSTWYALFSAKDTNNVTRQFFVEFDTTAAPAGRFRYGYVDTTVPTGATFAPQTAARVTGAVDTTKSQIVMKLDTSTPLSFTPPAGATTTAFTASFGSGTAFTLVQGRTDAVATSVDTTSTQVYNVQGNISCAPNNAPLAVLLADVTSGDVPFTVNFNGSASTDPDVIDTIASYTFNFGDGSAPVTQSTPTISHNYALAGNWVSSLSVTDSRGKASIGTSTANISANNPAPRGTLQLSSATYSVGEGGISAQITITRTGGSGGLIGLTVTTSNGSATAGSDYSSISSVLNWTDGDTGSKILTIPIIEDTTVEGDETVNISLTNATGGTSFGSPSSAVLTIVDNDNPSNPPTITVIAAGPQCQAEPVTLTITGTNFFAGSVVQIDGATRTSSFLSSTQLRITLASADLGAAHSFALRVVNPDGGFSSPLTVVVPVNGDVDLQSTVDAVDLTLVANYLVGNVNPGIAPFKAPVSAADVNGDGSANAVDLVVFANYLVGNVPCLAAP